MTSVSDILDDIESAASEDRSVSVEALSDRIGHRGTGALLSVPAALELTPIGGIPGVPTFLAAVIAILAAQIALGRTDLWLPGVLGHRTLRSARVRAALDWLRPKAAWADAHLGRHLTVLTDAPAPRVAAVAVLVLCATVPPLEVVPFASSIPMATILLFGLGLTLRDGRVMALGWAAWIAALAAIWWLLF